MMSQAKWSWNYEKKELQFISKHSCMPEENVKQNTMLSKKTNLTRNVLWKQKRELPTRINKTGTSDNTQDFVNEEDPIQNQKKVTVEDVIDVSLKLTIPEENSLLSRKIQKVCGLSVFRPFILAVLQYFHYYLQMQAWEQSITQPLEGGAGKSSEKENNIFEILYKLLTEAVWITFSRTQKECIEKEIGRLMKSEVFNRYETLWSYSSKAEQKNDGSYHLTKSLGKEKIRHIPRHILLSQRSPLLDSLFPHPSKVNCTTNSHQRLPVSEVHLVDIQSIGILGDDRNQYNELLEQITNTLQEESTLMVPSSKLR
ncbi:uncharacterized protein LOC143226755 isoform X4 [Tachypleus tridentatus]|uniref:uncharacterized protein LOC143226755 isoform X4 n=1 Tax=Tachypleus tridentatus TaxID=6853 RepID=UPI003FD54280